MARFEYLEARTLRQAVSLLKRYGEEAQVVAGTTDFLVRWRQGFWQPSYVVSIKRIPGLDRVSYSPRTGLRLGTLATVRTLETHPIIRQHYPALSSTAATFAGVQIRNLPQREGTSATPLLLVIPSPPSWPFKPSVGLWAQRVIGGCPWTSSSWAAGGRP